MNEAAAWTLLLGLADRARRGEPVLDARELRLDESPAGGAEAKLLLDLYLPLCVGPACREQVVGHLAQSLDGRIATNSGASQYITGSENLVHAHRMRALHDAVMVGAETVLEDDPRLTTRLVPGRNPVRVVIDPNRRLGLAHQIFQDGAGPTLLLCSRENAGAERHGQAEVVPLEAEGGLLPPAAIVAELKRRGLRRVFIEGGGVTVSRFLQARALTRLHVAVAPLLFGSGRPAISLPEIADLSQAVLLECRHFVSGRDVLFDCTFAG